MRMNKKTMLLIIPAIALLACCIAAICVICIPSSYEVYTKQIQTAEKYLADKDYDGAIKYYEMAKATDETQEEPYLKLAMIYYENKNDMEKAVAILNEGYEKTKSEQIKNALAVYQGAGEKNTDTSGKTDYNGNPVNITLLNMFGQYNYEQYSKNYTVVSDNYSDGVYTVRYNGIGAEFSYSNDSTKAVDEKTMKPFAYSFPTEIKVDKISDIINLPPQGMKIDGLKKSAGITNAVAKYDNTLKKNIITFSCEKCTVSVETDKNGTITANTSYITVNPETVAAVARKSKVSGKVISVTTADIVSSAEVVVRKGKDSKDGDGAAEVSIDSGNYSVELETGDYTFEVSASGYKKEYFNVYVSGADQEKDFSISPSLAEGEIRIVLEWGATPSDLDSHLEGTTKNGDEVSIYWMNPVATSGAKTIAQLDVDDRDGYGPETITLSELDGTYQYRVHRFSSSGSLAMSGAVVKVYSGSSEPITISVPSDCDEWWDVFTIENGEIKNINGATN